jgi:predicted  nucleic acid-binding Zn-ribbon protein
VTGPQGPAETLLALQDIDIAIAQLLHQRAHLPERTAEATESAAVDAIRKKVALVAERRQAIADAQTGLERSLRELDARAADLAAKLPRTTVVREAEALLAEQQTVRQRVSAIEDEELVLLEEDEALDAEDAAVRAELAAAEERLARAVEARERAEAVVDDELAQRRAEREREAAPLPADLLARYDRLRAQHDGVAVARLIGGRCDGCHLMLAQAALERIRNAPPDEVVECEECGRLLAR